MIKLTATFKAYEDDDTREITLSYPSMPKGIRFGMDRPYIANLSRYPICKEEMLWVNREIASALSHKGKVTYE